MFEDGRERSSSFLYGHRDRGAVGPWQAAGQTCNGHYGSWQDMLILKLGLGHPQLLYSEKYFPQFALCIEILMTFALSNISYSLE